MGFRVQVLGDFFWFRVEEVYGLRARGLGFRAWGLGLGV